MIKITCTSFIIFTSIIVNIESAKVYPGTLITTVTSFQVAPDNEYMEQKGDDSITWKKTVTDAGKLEVTLQNYGVVAILCQGSQDEYLQDFLIATLGNNQDTCPIQKGVTSNILRPHKRATKRRKQKCEPISAILKLGAKEAEIMTINFTSVYIGEMCV